MADEQPGFEKVDRRGRYQRQKETLEEYQRERDQQAKKAAREQRIRDEIATFSLVIDNIFVPLAFNMISGQVSVRYDALEGGEEHYAFSTSPQDYRPIRAADGLSLLNMHPHEYDPLDASERPVDVFPSWFFAKSNEPRDEIDRVIKRIRRKVFFGRISNRIRRGVDWLKNLGFGVFFLGGFIVFVAIGTALINGLLEFGRKQL